MMQDSTYHQLPKAQIRAERANNALQGPGREKREHYLTVDFNSMCLLGCSEWHRAWPDVEYLSDTLALFVFYCLFQVSIHQRQGERKSKYVDLRDNNSNKSSWVIWKMQTKLTMWDHMHGSDQQNYQVLYYHGLVCTWFPGTLLTLSVGVYIFFTLKTLKEISSITAAPSSTMGVDTIGWPV